MSAFVSTCHPARFDCCWAVCDIMYVCINWGELWGSRLQAAWKQS